MTNEEAQTYFNIVLKQLASETTGDNRQTLEKRFENSGKVLKFENNYIYIIVKDSLTKLLIEKFSSRRMNEILESVVGTKTGLKFITEEDAKREKEETVAKFAKVDHSFDRSKRRLRAEFTFNNFVVGESNRFAFISGMKVADSPIAVLNPLYIFGDIGLGKTHLMMAIGHYILDKDINTNVIYTSAQQFCEDYFVYTKRNIKDIEVFYDKYRSADVLLVDDIQFLENKPSTQEEFFKVFDYLHENNKQIVVTSDRKASDLKIMSRLKSRFSWGMPVDIKAPDDNLRLNILRKKLEFLISSPSDVPDTCLKIITDNFKTNVRELEGALNRYVTYCVSMNLPFNDENVYLTLQSIMPRNAAKKVFSDDMVDNLKAIIANYFRLSTKDLVSTSRKPNLVYARNLCFFILRTDYNYPLQKIGGFFGGKDHTTVMYGVEKITENAKINPKIMKDIKYIKQKMGNQ